MLVVLRTQKPRPSYTIHYAYMCLVPLFYTICAMCAQEIGKTSFAFCVIFQFSIGNEYGMMARVLGHITNMLKRFFCFTI